MMGDLIVILGIAVLAGVVGLWLGMVVLEPRLRRRLEEGDDERAADEEADREAGDADREAADADHEAGHGEPDDRAN
jgi:flagellar biosynthesis/type III secretory pathway M-ring protein FliF/YscJ